MMTPYEKNQRTAKQARQLADLHKPTKAHRLALVLGLPSTPCPKINRFNAMFDGVAENQRRPRK